MLTGFTHKLIEALTMKQLATEAAARSKRLQGQVQGQLGEQYGPWLIHGPYPTYIGCHIGKNKVSPALADS